jgi:hypothetical protein
VAKAKIFLCEPTMHNPEFDSDHRFLAPLDHALRARPPLYSSTMMFRRRRADRDESNTTWMISGTDSGACARIADGRWREQKPAHAEVSRAFASSHVDHAVAAGYALHRRFYRGHCSSQAHTSSWRSESSICSGDVSSPIPAPFWPSFVGDSGPALRATSFRSALQSLIPVLSSFTIYPGGTDVHFPFLGYCRCPAACDSNGRLPVLD